MKGENDNLSFDNSYEELKDKVVDQVYKTIGSEKHFTDDEIIEIIETEVMKQTRDIYLRYELKNNLIKQIYNSIRKLDILQDLIEDKSISEIMINGYKSVHIERNGVISKYPIGFSSKEKLEDVIQQIVSKVNRIVNESNPIVDLRLMDGSRVNVVLPPIALNGPIVTIRKFPDKPFTMERLIEIGSLTEEAASYLKILVESGYNIFISGGTGSGKTTFLNALSNFIPSDERVITIEDSAELQLQNIDNLVRLEARNANVEGKNEVTIRDLVRSSLRMRPDRIVIGEIRDAAVIELLNAMNTGHDGSLSTGHANSCMDMLHRMETLYLTGMDVPLQAVRGQIGSAIDIIIQLGRLRDKSRKVLEIDEIIGVKDEEYELQTLFEFIDEGDNEDGSVKGKLIKTENKIQNTRKLTWAGKVLF